MFPRALQTTPRARRGSCRKPSRTPRRSLRSKRAESAAGPCGLGSRYRAHACTYRTPRRSAAGRESVARQLAGWLTSPRAQASGTRTAPMSSKLSRRVEKFSTGVAGPPFSRRRQKGSPGIPRRNDHSHGGARERPEWDEGRPRMRADAISAMRAPGRTGFLRSPDRSPTATRDESRFPPAPLPVRARPPYQGR